MKTTTEIRTSQSASELAASLAAELEETYVDRQLTERQRAQLRHRVWVLTEQLASSIQSQPTVWSPPQLAARWKISPEKVIGWIRTGQLKAINLATDTNGRPRYRITAESVEAFENARCVQASPKPIRRKRRTTSDVIEFF